MTAVEDQMAQYDEDSDPRENARRNDIPGLGPLGEAPWLLQVSLKTPAGTLINIRGMNQWDIAVGLEAIQGLANQVKETEDRFGYVAPATLAPLGARPAPPQVQQQANPQQAAGPNCNCGFPARFVAGGISKRTNKPYRAFYACGNPVREAECGFRSNA